MSSEFLFEHPFGTKITAEEIIDSLSFFDDWEDRYRYIIDLGKQLPEFPDVLKCEELLVRGCQSQVWLLTRPDGSNDNMQLAVDSDALVVRGLAAIVLAAYHNKSARELLAFDIEGYFSSIDLLKHLSPTRGNGVRAMVKKIRSAAEQVSH